MSRYDAAYSVYVGNLDASASVADLEELIYELFLQVSFLILVGWLSLMRVTMCRLVRWKGYSSQWTVLLGSIRTMALSSLSTRSLFPIPFLCWMV
jgi:hypothetical protein